MATYGLDFSLGPIHCDGCDGELTGGEWVEGFRYHSKIPRKAFTFGGTAGTTITTIAFQLT